MSSYAKRLLFLMLAVTLVTAAYMYFTRTPRSEAPVDAEVTALPLSPYSAAFQAQTEDVIQCYLGLKDALVEDSLSSARQRALRLSEALGRMDTLEWKRQDSALYPMAMSTLSDLKRHALALSTQDSLTGMRRAFSDLTQSLFPVFFTITGYAGARLYLQECPMAFNDTETAHWISNSREILNPYLGKHHPTYGAGMLHCGEVVDSLKTQTPP